MSKYEARQDFCWSVALDTREGGDVVKEAVLYTLSKLGPEVAENCGANLELHLSGRDYPTQHTTPALCG